MTDDLAETLRILVERLDAQGIAYMLVGSVAALAHGRARATQDFDVVVEARPDALRALLRSLPEERFHASEEAAMEALEDVRELVRLGRSFDRDYVERWVEALGLASMWTAIEDT